MEIKRGNMKKILVRGPALSRSGYGEQTRFALRALRAHQDRFDIYLIPVGWGQTGWIYEDTEERRWIDSLVAKTFHHNQSNGQYDMSLQVTIPNEWEKLAPVNIGYTAGIETTRVSPVWIEKSALMDKIIVVSNHSKEVFEKTVYSITAEQQPRMMSVPPKDVQIAREVKCLTPVEAVNYSVRQITPKPIDLELDYDFNFLTMAQWSPRKNLENTIHWFMEEFANDEVGLIAKVSIRNNSILDNDHAYDGLHNIIQNYPERKCKLYMLHGDLTEEEMTGLYSNSKVKALINLSHGEGFGLPMFEAACNGLPVVAPNWSGQNDFLYAPEKDKKKPNKKAKMRPHFANVDYVLKPVQDSAVWDGVIEKDSMWCFSHKGSYRKAIRSIYSDHGFHIKRAAKLKKYIIENFTEEKQYKKFADFIVAQEEHEIGEWLNNLDVKEIA
jgi:glycosyltransferase involved in cell wall biosynthesis